ncbi:MAG TPA: YggT family protein [Acidimicrobiales bacterium]|nr:YggT family protein [Acidimicrobiales bacterium]
MTSALLGGAGGGGLGLVLYDLGRLYLLVLIGRALLSWFPPSYDSPLNGVRRVVFTLTEPVLAPFRRVVPTVGMFDLSFLVAFLVVSAIVNYILPRL